MRAPQGPKESTMITRRELALGGLAVVGVAAAGLGVVKWRAGGAKAATDGHFEIVRTPEEWQKLLTPEQYAVLREEDTERPFTSPLNDEKRKGVFACAGCDLPLFTSDMKYESGTGWPSFFTTIPGVFATRKDYVLFVPRTEYHCVRCGGHHGHVFDDGPPPTRQRWCNNGVALKFIPKQA
jgi:peptide-methionine (R)-S-oxide reductase